MLRRGSHLSRMSQRMSELRQWQDGSGNQNQNQTSRPGGQTERQPPSPAEHTCLSVCRDRQASMGTLSSRPPPHLWTQLPYMGVEEWWALWKVSHWRHPPGITLNTNKFLATGLERWLNRKELQLLLQRPWVQVPAPTC